ncbi:DUF1254 domain-containing protein [Streptomyces griseus]|uniref:DUF1254 domain-containing protein n=1 Tax=Streptomyces griseus TaxID=1911 RepID=UPI0008405E7A|nr:DUF1254 domain-containing protein [Streptomyces griseus]
MGGGRARPGRPDTSAALAADAYVYGSPLVRQLSAVRACLREGCGGLGPAPFNDFAHAAGPATPGTDVPSAASDAVAALAQLDLSGGPVRLHVPDTGGAYYVLQFVDAWTNAFAYIGRRATGTGEGDWLVVPPGWSGTVPDQVSGVIDAPTSVVSVVGRIACDGPADLPRVRALQQEFTLTHLGDRAHRTGLPAPDPAVPAALRFFEQLRMWMADFPAADADRAYEDRFQPLGLLEEGVSPYVSASPGLVRTLTRGLWLGRARVAEAARPAEGTGRAPGSWAMHPHLFDYNLDRTGVGTLASPEWKIPDRESSYLVRAIAARQELWGAHGYEMVCAQTYRDARGHRLDGAHRYALRFRRPPPVDGFWSVTMYDTPGHRLVANEADRYAIGDRTPGLVHDADGSLTLYLGAERPTDPAQAANWLPAPLGGFRPVIRLYQPGQAALDGGYVLPPVERIR